MLKKNILNQIRFRFPILYKQLLLQYNVLKGDNTLRLKYNLNDLTKTNYAIAKKSGNEELEHQIGRLTNFKTIIEKCKKLDGDFIEFGTWKGFSLLWIAYILESNKIFNKKIVGVDSFNGLPYDDGVFKKGDFIDTTLNLCKNNVYKSEEIKSKIKEKIIIFKSLFIEKEYIIDRFKRDEINKLCFVHIDCDVYQSVLEIFDILETGNLLANRVYLLIDDYGCNSSLKKAIDKKIAILKKRYSIKTVSETRLTKNFYLSKKMKTDHNFYK